MFVISSHSRLGVEETVSNRDYRARLLPNPYHESKRSKQFCPFHGSMWRTRHSDVNTIELSRRSIPPAGEWINCGFRDVDALSSGSRVASMLGTNRQFESMLR